MLDQAAAQQAEIVCLPQDCVPTDGGPSAQAALDAIAQAAAKGKMYVAANLREQDGGQLYSTSYLLGPDGRVIGKYRKSHRLPDENIALGNELPVFDTPLGKIGLMIGTDHYWPEIPLVMALEGAELILASLGVEPVPQQFPLEITLRTRAFDDHVTLAAANYAGDLPYLCSNHPAYTGQPLGRGCVIDRAGIILADTGIRPGVAVAPVDLARPKDVYHLTFKEDRSLFHYLADADVKRTVFKGPQAQDPRQHRHGGVRARAQPPARFGVRQDPGRSREARLGRDPDDRVRPGDRRRERPADAGAGRRESEAAPQLRHHRRPARSADALSHAAAAHRGRTSGTAADRSSASTAFPSTATASSCRCSKPTLA